MVLTCFSCGLKLHLLGVFSVQKPRVEAGSAPLSVICSLSWIFSGFSCSAPKTDCLAQIVLGVSEVTESSALPPRISPGSHLVPGAQACQYPCFCFSNAGLNVIQACALLGCFWGTVSLFLSRQPGVCWAPGRCRLGCCCYGGAGDAFGFLLGGLHPGRGLFLAGWLWPFNAFEPNPVCNQLSQTWGCSKGLQGDGVRVLLLFLLLFLLCSIPSPVAWKRWQDLQTSFPVCI